MFLSSSALSYKSVINHGMVEAVVELTNQFLPTCKSTSCSSYIHIHMHMYIHCSTLTMFVVHNRVFSSYMYMYIIHVYM